MTLSKPLLAAALAGIVSLGAVPLAHAAFVDPATATTSFSTAQLAAPTGLTVQKRCSLSLLGLIQSASLDLAWTRSSSTWATGQRVIVTGPNGFSETQNLGATATSTTVTLPLIAGGTYTATVRATYGSWTSGAVTATTTGC